MKKESNLSPAGRKLNLSRRTISNLKASEMSNKMGGIWTAPCASYGCGTGKTKNGNTCPGHASCYAC